MASKRLRLIALSMIVLLVLISSSLALSKTFTVRETDLVQLEAEAIDLDGDNIVYYYSPPLNDKGEWQTGYDDAGVYNLVLTASDGIHQVNQTVKLIVENRNQAPYLSDNKISSKETQTIDLKNIIVDPDNDPLNYNFNAPFDSNGVWNTDYDDEGTYITDVSFGDGQFNNKGRIEITVLKTNQPPLILKLFEEDKIVNAEEGKELRFSVQASDSDDDNLAITWIYDDEIISERNTGDFFLDYNQKGDHDLKLVVSDGITEVVREWTVRVEGTNRGSELVLFPTIVYEGETIFLDVPDVDLDGDELSYAFEFPLDQEGKWVTGYDDAGKYELEVTVSDGEFIVSGLMEIEVLEVDRSPILKLPEELRVYEDETLSYTFDAIDLDGDDVKFSFDGLPKGAEFKDRTLTWNPGYDYIKRSGGLFSNLLNTLRLEQMFLNSRSFNLAVTACSDITCITENTEVIVYNVNRKPEFTILNDITITELDSVQLNTEAIDPDGDIVRVYYTDPLKRKSGKWQTDYDDDGVYTSYATATDGRAEVTAPVQITVNKNNREPSLDIQDDELVVNENQQFMFKVEASDPDDDELTISLDNPPAGASFNDGIFLWTPPYNSVTNRSEGWLNNFVSNFDYLNKKFNSEKATVWLNFVVSDGSTEVVHPVKVTIKNSNLAPDLLDFIPVNQFMVKVGEPTIFHVTAKDQDNDRLVYEWDFGMGQTTVKGTDTVSRTFTSPGKKKIKVSVDDGRDEVEREWEITAVQDNVMITEEPGSTAKNDPFTVKIYEIENERREVTATAKDVPFTVKIYEIENERRDTTSVQKKVISSSSPVIKGDPFNIKVYIIEGK
jgi:hypothetical protein